MVDALEAELHTDIVEWARQEGPRIWNKWSIQLSGFHLLGSPSISNISHYNHSFTKSHPTHPPTAHRSSTKPARVHPPRRYACVGIIYLSHTTRLPETMDGNSLHSVVSLVLRSMTFTPSRVSSPVVSGTKLSSVVWQAEGMRGLYLH